MKSREEIEEKYKWNLKGYFETDKQFDEEFESIKQDSRKILTYENKLKNKKNILQVLNLESEISQRFSVLYVYAALRVKVNAENSKNKQRLNNVEKFSIKLDEETAFVDVEIKEQSNDVLKEFAKDEDFADYSLYFKDIIKSKKHTLSKPEEKLLSASGAICCAEEVFDMFDAADISFEDIKNKKRKKLPMNSVKYGLYMQSGDRVLRKNAYVAMNGAFEKLKNTISANYMANVKADCFYAKVRKFNSAFEASLYGSDVDKKIYDMLANSVESNLGTFHKYFKAKQKLLKQKDFAIYDLWADVEKTNETYSYEESLELCKTALAPLGEEYVSMLDVAKQDGWIDVMPSKGKDTGAFSWGAYGKNPVVLLNHNNTLSCAFTLAHELGHAMHTYYSNKNQIFQKAGYEIFVAEVASTTNEMLLVLHLLNNAKTEKEKVFYVEYLLSMFTSTVHRQMMFSRFEEHAHSAYENGEDTTMDALCSFYENLNKKYFGKDVLLAEQTKFEWLRIPHFYSSFYVYKYATGLISAFYIANKIYEGDKKTLDGYLKFLTLGCTKKPVDLLKVANVNLEKEEIYNFVFKKLEEYLNMLK